MLPLITSEMQDNTLRWLCANVQPGQMTPFDWQDLLEFNGLDTKTTDIILDDFKDRGLIGFNYSFERIGPALILKVEAHKFLQRGGFTVMDALNEANMQKLLYELENLKKQLQPNQFETFNKVASLMSSIAAVVSAFPSDK